MSEIPTSNLKTPIGMVSYPHLFKPQAAEEGQKPKHSVTLVFDKEAQATPEFKALQAAAIAVADKKYPGEGRAKLLAGQDNGGIRSPFRKDATSKGYPEGSVFINIRSDGKPGVVSRVKGPDGKTPTFITEAEQVVGNPNEIYPGCLGRATVTAYTYERKGNKGVSFGLNNFQKMGEGARIDSRKSAGDEFDADLTETPAEIEDLL